MFGIDRLFAFDLHRSNSPWEDAPPWALELRQMLRILIREERITMTMQSDIADALARVQSDVAAQTSVVASVKTYVKGLKDQIDALAAASSDQSTAQSLRVLADQIEANTASDAAAIVANTGVSAGAPSDKPADPPPPAAPVAGDPGTPSSS